MSVGEGDAKPPSAISRRLRAWGKLILMLRLPCSTWSYHGPALYQTLYHARASRPRKGDWSRRAFRGRLKAIFAVQASLGCVVILVGNPLSRIMYRALTPAASSITASRLPSTDNQSHVRLSIGSASFTADLTRLAASIDKVLRLTLRVGRYRLFPSGVLSVHESPYLPQLATIIRYLPACACPPQLASL